LEQRGTVDTGSALVRVTRAQALAVAGSAGSVVALVALGFGVTGIWWLVIAACLVAGLAEVGGG
jgi:fatty acid desaturase